MKEQPEREKFGINCPNCDHPVDEPVNDIWRDPNVKIALKEGRPAEDIAVLACPDCNRWGYYNQGSTFWCRFCHLNFECLSEGEEPERGQRYIRVYDTGRYRNRHHGRL